MINWEKVKAELFDIIDDYKKELAPSDLDEGPDEEFDIIKKKISLMCAGFSKEEELEEKISDNQKFCILESTLVKFCNDIFRDYPQDKNLSHFNKTILNFLQVLTKKIFCYDKQFILFLGKEDSSIYQYALQKKWRNLDRQRK